MKDRQEKLELLWRCADGQGSAEDMQNLERWVATDAELQKEWEEIQSLNTQLGEEITVAEPSMRFRANVLDRLAAKPVLPPEQLIPEHWKPRLIIAFCLLTLLSTFKGGSKKEWHLIPEWEIDYDFLITKLTAPLLEWHLSPYWVFFLAILLLLLLDRLFAHRIYDRHNRSTD